MDLATISKMAASGASVKQLIAKLDELGEVAFIGKGLVIEQAQKFGVLLDIDGAADRAIPYNWREAYTVKPKHREVKPDNNGQTLDTVLPEIRTKSEPGTFERLEQLAQYYKHHLPELFDSKDGQSPFLISDNAIATRLAGADVERQSSPVYVTNCGNSGLADDMGKRMRGNNRQSE